MNLFFMIAMVGAITPTTAVASANELRVFLSPQGYVALVYSHEPSPFSHTYYTVEALAVQLLLYNTGQNEVALSGSASD